jgi:hypothetical protein
LCGPRDAPEAKLLSFGFYVVEFSPAESEELYSRLSGTEADRTRLCHAVIETRPLFGSRSKVKDLRRAYFL